EPPGREGRGRGGGHPRPRRHRVGRLRRRGHPRRPHADLPGRALGAAPSERERGYVVEGRPSMKISGEAQLKAGVAEVYAALQDPAVLVRTLPGCEQLEQTGPDSYRATLTAGVASIKGRFNGEVRLADH